jgi:ABC-type proline/glycine betaine transport system substrate-binding protein
MNAAVTVKMASREMAKRCMLTISIFYWMYVLLIKVTLKVNNSLQSSVTSVVKKIKILMDLIKSADMVAYVLENLMKQIGCQIDVVVEAVSVR